MTRPRSILVFIFAVALSVPFGVHAEDMPETAYDESASMPFESIPGVSIAAPKVKRHLPPDRPSKLLFASATKVRTDQLHRRVSSQAVVARPRNHPRCHRVLRMRRIVTKITETHLDAPKENPSIPPTISLVFVPPSVQQLSNNPLPGVFSRKTFVLEVKNTSQGENYEAYEFVHYCRSYLVPGPSGAIDTQCFCEQ